MVQVHRPLRGPGPGPGVTTRDSVIPRRIGIAGGAPASQLRAVPNAELERHGGQSWHWHDDRDGRLSSLAGGTCQ